MSAVDDLPPGAVPAAEVLRQMEMEQVVWLVDARHLGQKRVLNRQVDHVDSRTLDRPVGLAHGIAWTGATGAARPGPGLPHVLGVADSRDPGEESCMGRSDRGRIQESCSGSARNRYSSSPSSSFESPAASPITACSTPPNWPPSMRASTHTLRGFVDCARSAIGRASLDLHGQGSLISSAWPLGSASRLSGSARQKSSITSRCS